MTTAPDVRRRVALWVRVPCADCHEGKAMERQGDPREGYYKCETCNGLGYTQPLMLECPYIKAYVKKFAYSLATAKAAHDVNGKNCIGCHGTGLVVRKFTLDEVLMALAAMGLEAGVSTSLDNEGVPIGLYAGYVFASGPTWSKGMRDGDAEAPVPMDALLAACDAARKGRPGDER